MAAVVTSVLFLSLGSVVTPSGIEFAPLMALGVVRFWLLNLLCWRPSF